jgi:hypothetical protein
VNRAVQAFLVPDTTLHKLVARTQAVKELVTVVRVLERQHERVRAGARLDLRDSVRIDPYLSVVVISHGSKAP